MLTDDVKTVERFALDCHFIWLGLLETIVVVAILWSHVGVTILLAIIYTCFVLILQTICGKCIQLISYTKHFENNCLCWILCFF
jgi:hypothetical protein